MKTLILKTKSKTLQVVKNIDNTLSIFKLGTTEIIPNIGLYINQMGGLQAVLDRCQEFESVEAYKIHVANLAAARAIELAPIKAARLEQDKKNAELFKKQIADLLALDVIPSTRENLRLIMKYLNESNWGGWKLPKMEISYSAYSFDCDGKLAVGIKLDKPVDGFVKYSYNAPRGYLNSYQNI